MELPSTCTIIVKSNMINHAPPTHYIATRQLDTHFPTAITLNDNLFITLYKYVTCCGLHILEKGIPEINE